MQVWLCVAVPRSGCQSTEMALTKYPERFRLPPPSAWRQVCAELSMIPALHDRVLPVALFTAEAAELQEGKGTWGLYRASLLAAA